MSIPSKRHLLLGLGALPAASLLASAAGCATAAAPPAASTTGPDPADWPQGPASPPLRPDGVLSRIAVTSCSNEDRPAPLFGTIQQRRTDLLLMLGDNVYGSNTPDDPMLSGLRDAYAMMAQRGEFAGLVGAVPTLAVWDDHDFGKNDAGGDFAHKATAQQMFNRFWRIPSGDPLRSRPGIYRTTTSGPPGRRTQIILLDTRYFRSPLVPTDQRNAPGRERYLPHPRGANVTLLGEDQWRWLQAQLREPADLRLICSSIQVVADGHGWERWGNFPDERDRLYRLIGSTGAGGVVFLSGDRHHGSVHRSRPDGLYPLHDLTASAINMPSSMVAADGRSMLEDGPTRIGAGYGPVNFGEVEIDWDRRRIDLRLVGEGAEVVQQVELALGDLAAPQRS
jgi:alkaline phosphatase D